MQVIDAAHVYQTDDGQTIKFIKRTNGELVHAGTTNEELLEVLIDRLGGLDAKFPCAENKDALKGMRYALGRLNDRTRARVSQGVETQDIEHVSDERRIQYLDVGSMSPEDAADLIRQLTARVQPTEA